MSNVSWLLGVHAMFKSEYVEHAVIGADKNASMCVAVCGDTTLAPDPDWENEPELTPRRCEKCVELQHEYCSSCGDKLEAYDQSAGICNVCRSK